MNLGFRKTTTGRKLTKQDANESTHYISPRKQGCSRMNMNHAWISVRTHTCFGPINIWGLRLPIFKPIIINRGTKLIRASFITLVECGWLDGNHVCGRNEIKARMDWSNIKPRSSKILGCYGHVAIPRFCQYSPLDKALNMRINILRSGS